MATPYVWYEMKEEAEKLSLNLECGFKKRNMLTNKVRNENDGEGISKGECYADECSSKRAACEYSTKLTF